MKSFLSYSMVLIFALQSIVALADVHQTHQSGQEHLSFEHDHTEFESNSPPNYQHNFEQSNSSASLQTKSPDDSFDCHHCCHCHGVHPAWIVNSYSFASTTIASSSDSIFIYSLPRTIHEKLLRPPIA